MAKTTKTKKPKETPLMAQYNKIKSKYPDAVLLFRVGDFYETFGEDAIRAAKVLGITLTKRGAGSSSEIELAGFPHHSLDTYLPKLVKAGLRVAICDQLEDPKMTKTIVKRGVTELITPGVAVNDKILDHDRNNFLAAVQFGKGVYGVSFLDVSTGEFMVAEGDRDHIDNLLQSFRPAEVIYPKGKMKQFKEEFGAGFYTYTLDDWIFAPEFTNDLLLNHFGTKSLKGFGIDDMEHGPVAAGAIVHYLGETEHPNLKHITGLSRLHRDRSVWLDKFTVRNLELVYSPHGGTTLIDVLDLTLSPMGSRTMRKWMLLPLKDRKSIEARHSTVEHLIKDQELLQSLKEHIKPIGDLERLISKVPLGKINPREMVQIRRALGHIDPIIKACAASGLRSLKAFGDQLNPCQLLHDKILNELHEDAPVNVQKGGVIQEGVSPELDDLRSIVRSGKEYLLRIQQRESERTGIPSLKIGFNNVFGYYLEVTNAHKAKVPEEWLRKQTLTNAERYITEELKEYEEKILGAGDRISQLEEQLFQELVSFCFDYIRPVQVDAALIGQLDCLVAFAEGAMKYDYRRPELTDGFELDIKGGRHPVIERQMEVGENYIPNDVYLDTENQQIITITGPNMAGKSALLRQTALIVLMAQVGAFVPASSVKMGVVDKVFTRVGASDNISSGESTFMVEMNETASIVNNISERSLILLDEIGRGTSTYDGISIAWSIAEYLHNNPTAKPKTLFATHYHELNELANKFERIKNYNVSTKEVGNKVIFLRKLVEGGSQHSFGIHVARMAGMPKLIVDRANDILKELEQKHIASDIKDKVKQIAPADYQLNIFEVEDKSAGEARRIIEGIDINTITPVESLMKLNELKKVFEKG